MDQLLVQVDEGGSRPCGVEGESLVEVWRGGKVLVACGARPFAKRARPCCLLGRQGSQAPWSFGDFLLFLDRLDRFIV